MRGRIAVSTMARIFAGSSAAQLVRGVKQKEMRAIARWLVSLDKWGKVIFPFYNVVQRLHLISPYLTLPHLTSRNPII
jgi:hypothetical protein